MPFDPYLNEEAVAEVPERWQGPYHFGAPDGVVVNVTREQIWVREGILPAHPNNRAPQYRLHQRAARRTAPAEAPRGHPGARRPRAGDRPEKYYPKGYHPELLQEWPVEGDLVVPVESLPENLKESMGQEWRLRQKNRQALQQGDGE